MCITIIGALRQMSSSSNLSKIAMVTDVPCFEVSNDSDSTRCPVEVYSLNDISTYLNFDAVTFQGWKNEDIACKCIHKLCKRNCSHLEFFSAIEFTDLKKQSPLIASSNQKPDIIIKQNDNVVFTAEVHSSPMYCTIKACIGGDCEPKGPKFLKYQHLQYPSWNQRRALYKLR